MERSCVPLEGNNRALEIQQIATLKGMSVLQLIAFPQEQARSRMMPLIARMKVVLLAESPSPCPDLPNTMNRAF